MYGHVFAGELLEWVSAERGGFPLQDCLLATSPSVHHAPWDSILDSAFVPQDLPWPECLQPHSAQEAPTSTMAGPCSQQGTSTLQPPSGCPGRGPQALSKSSNEGVGEPQGGPGLLDGRGSPEAFYTGGSSPGPGGRWFRKSYVEALRNPVPLGTSSEESLLDEAADEAVRPLTPGSRPKVTTSPVQRTSWGSHLHTDRAVMASRRSRSWDKPLQSPLGKTRQETSDPSGHQPEGRPGGQAAGKGTVGSCVAVGSPESPQEKEGVPLASTGSPRLVPGTFSDKQPQLLGPKGVRTPELGAPAQAWGDISALLHVGSVMLPGTRDRGGRAVVQVCTGGPSWAGEQASRAELTRLLLYLHSVPRKEVRDLGLVVLVDARKGPVTPALSQALLALQNTAPPVIHSILLLVDKESVIKPDKEATMQCDVVSSLKALHKLIDGSQLTAALDGTFPYSHRDWMCFRRTLEAFMVNCKQAFAFLQDALCALSPRRAPGTAQEATELIHRHRAVMRHVLEDPLLVTLRLEGGAVLARLRRDAPGASEDSRDALQAATRLYDRVDEEVHRLVRTSNRCLQWLEDLQRLQHSEQGTAQVPRWLEREPELTVHPKEPPTPGSQSEVHEGISALQEAAVMAAGWRPPCREDPKHVGSCCQQADVPKEPRPSQALWSPMPSRPEQALPVPHPGCSSPLSPLEASPAQEDMHWGPEVPALGDCPDGSSPCPTAPSWAPGPHLRKQPLKKMMRTQSCEAALPAGPREPRQPGHTGVYIRGLEVTSSVAAETPPDPRNRSLSSPSRVSAPNGDGRPRAGSRLHHIVAEMVATEREYVKSLGYVIDNYFPEMERTDLPQDLRGKRGTIFGNLEKLHGFHGQHFLRELERCRHCPLAVGRGFLKHEEQFCMYALYSKNKPLSDALLSSHGNAFFKAKQQALGDKMDLASYLLKPVQRMSKYALLLADLVKEAARNPAREQELGQLRAAESMVRFQLRHGNDLLAMDAVRGCDVNLKEQGPLRCQDEFVVCCGRRKYLRQVFLFEDLILFSKTKKMDGGYDIYVYKQSFKTAEIGMTENVGDSGLRFEIWFRRRRRSQDTYILQASSAEVKAAWTGLIGRILWRQALRNRELRMQEMVSMGIGNKPFMDIQPSDAAISDRAIDYILKRTEPRSRASIAVSSFDRATPFKRPHSTISESSTSSSSSRSSSVLGPLNLHVYPSPPGPLSPWSRDGRACIEEDELEQETGSQPSMTTESSASSQCTSGDSAGCPGSSPHPGLRQLADKDDGTSSPGCRTPTWGASPPLPSRSSRRCGGQLTTSSRAEPSWTEPHSRAEQSRIAELCRREPRRAELQSLTAPDRAELRRAEPSHTGQSHRAEPRQAEASHHAVAALPLSGGPGGARSGRRAEPGHHGARPLPAALQGRLHAGARRAAAGLADALATGRVPAGRAAGAQRRPSRGPARPALPALPGGLCARPARPRAARHWPRTPALGRPDRPARCAGAALPLRAAAGPLGPHGAAGSDLRGAASRAARGWTPGCRSAGRPLRHRRQLRGGGARLAPGPRATAPALPDLPRRQSAARAAAAGAAPSGPRGAAVAAGGAQRAAACRARGAAVGTRALSTADCAHAARQGLRPAARAGPHPRWPGTLPGHHCHGAQQDDAAHRAKPGLLHPDRQDPTAAWVPADPIADPGPGQLRPEPRGHGLLGRLPTCRPPGGAGPQWPRAGQPVPSHLLPATGPRCTLTARPHLGGVWPWGRARGQAGTGPQCLPPAAGAPAPGEPAVSHCPAAPIWLPLPASRAALRGIPGTHGLLPRGRHLPAGWAGCGQVRPAEVRGGGWGAAGGAAAGRPGRHPDLHTPLRDLRPRRPGDGPRAGGLPAASPQEHPGEVLQHPGADGVGQALAVGSEPASAGHTWGADGGRGAGRERVSCLTVPFCLALVLVLWGWYPGCLFLLRPGQQGWQLSSSGGGGGALVSAGSSP